MKSRSVHALTQQQVVQYIVFGNYPSSKAEILTVPFRFVGKNAIIKATEEVCYKYV